MKKYKSGFTRFVRVVFHDSFRIQKQYESSGARNELKISFSGTRSVSASDDWEINIWGLDERSRDDLVLMADNTATDTRYHVRAVLEVGYKAIDDPFFTRKLFAGQIKRITFEKDGLDIKAIITLRRTLWEFPSPVCIPGDTSVVDAIKYVVAGYFFFKENPQRLYNGREYDLSEDVKKISDKTVQFLSEPKTKTTGSRPMTLKGDFLTNMNELSRQFGFDWSFDSDKIFIYATSDTDDGYIRTKSFVADKNNLINCQPEFMGDYMHQSGIKISTILDPSVRVFDSLQVYSSLYPRYANGEQLYTITQIDYSGSTHDADWNMEITAKRKYVFNKGDQTS